MDVETYSIQLPPYTRWLLFAFIVSLSVASRVYLTRKLLAIVISAVLASMFLLALLIQVLTSLKKEEVSNSDNDKNERKTSIECYAITDLRSDCASFEEDKEWRNDPGVIVDCVDDYTSEKEYHFLNRE
ncbi:uncharacterized protein [Apostichopus japonicus]|uniref:uncharacterized protein n=1 Tax=Stichopus japonicus TaxID=307972 RepID=UPI003AB3CDE0